MEELKEERNRPTTFLTYIYEGKKRCRNVYIYSHYLAYSIDSFIPYAPEFLMSDESEC